jgi:hypothetical protein
MTSSGKVWIATLPKGTIIRICGNPIEILFDAKIAVSKEDWLIIRDCLDGLDESQQ